MSTEIPVSHTKIAIPTLHGAVTHRARLLESLEEVLDRKLFLITAPAGYGKTTLLADYARQSSLPVCWLSLDTLDKDPQRFFAYIIAAIAKNFKTFGRNSTAALQSLTNIESEAETLLSAIVNEIEACIDEHFILIVDDYQFVDNVPALRDLFSRFILLAGENFHLILASRRLPDLPNIAQMVARQQVGGFDMEQLAFQPEEIRSLFSQAYDIDLTDTALDALLQETEGWVTGLLLSAAGATRSGTDLGTWAAQTNTGRAARASGVDLDAYLDEQLLAPQKPHIRDFLLKTSLLEEFDAALCADVFGQGDWKKLIESIRHNNLLVLPVGPNGRWLRYHNFFQDYLRRRFQEEEPEKARAILERLADVYQEQGEWEKAYAATRQLSNPERQIHLVESAGTYVLLSGRLITLQSWLNSLPSIALEQRPALLSLRGAMLCTMGNGEASLLLLDHAIQEFETQGETDGLAQALVRRAAAYRLTGKYSNAVADAQRAIQLASAREHLEPEHAEALRFKGLSHLRLGQADLAAAALEESLCRYEKLGENESIARLQMELGLACRATGNWTAASEYYQKALTNTQQQGNLSLQAAIYNNLGFLFHTRGNYEQAVKSVEKGLECIRKSGFQWQRTLLLATLGDILSDLDEYASARQAYETASQLAAQISYQFLNTYLSLAQVRLARLEGKLHEARAGIQRIQSEPAQWNGYELGLLHLENGCLLLAEKDPHAAIPELKKACDQFHNGNLVIDTAHARIWLAAAVTGSGERAAGARFLQEVMASHPGKSGETTLMNVLRHALPWLADLKSDPETGALLERVRQAGERLPILRKHLRQILTSIPLQGARLEAYAFGKPQVRMHGKTVTQSQWQTTSVRNLFFYFLSRSRPMTKEEIGEVFWPEISPENLKIRFKNEIYRLRRVVGQDVIVFNGDEYFFNPSTDYEYDIETFNTRLLLAQSAENTEEKIAHLQEAVGLWRGPYLQDVDEIWIWPERQHLEQAYLDALRQLVELQRQAGDLQTALQTCQRALETNPCLEEFVREAMRIHARMGNRLGVVWQYQACCQSLRSELNLEPEAETQNLYKRLTD